MEREDENDEEEKSKEKENTKLLEENIFNGAKNK